MKAMITLLTLIGCLSMPMTEGNAAGMAKAMEKKAFGATPDGKTADLYVLTNKNGMQVSITNYGGIVVSVKVPDRQGKLGDVVLGFDTLDGYVADKSYFGALIGRYGNRIGGAKFSIDGATYTLAKNNGENVLHGGILGFNKMLWEAGDVSTGDKPALELKYTSKDGEEGFPGNLMTTAVYTLTNKNELKIEYSATTDKKTVVNLTNHSYFNLAGPGSGDVLKCVLQLHADKFTPVDSGLIPTGELRSVEGTPFDFRKPKAIGARIDADDEQIKLGQGYDHNFVLTKDKQSGPTLAARVEEPTTGRVLEVWTTEPAVQFYTANFLDGTVHGKGGIAYGRRTAFCLETQHFPDSPNKPSFPSTLLSPGQRYHTITIYRFLTK
jgi:aldose 1-epimerase